MKVNVKRNSMIKNVLMACLFFISFSNSTFASEISFQQNTGNSPFESHENYSKPNEAFGGSNNYYSGLSYSPFQSGNLQALQSAPVLYGPGGDPIGGIPTGDGVHLLFLAVVGYCIFKAVKKQQIVKNLYNQ